MDLSEANAASSFHKEPRQRCIRKRVAGSVPWKRAISLLRHKLSVQKSNILSIFLFFCEHSYPAVNRLRLAQTDGMYDNAAGYSDKLWAWPVLVLACSGRKKG